MIIQNDIEKTNKEALEKVCLAQPILDKITSNPGLANVQARLGDSRWNGHFVMNTLDEVVNLYGFEYYESATRQENIPEKVRNFVREACNYKFGVLN